MDVTRDQKDATHSGFELSFGYNQRQLVIPAEFDFAAILPLEDDALFVNDF